MMGVRNDIAPKGESAPDQTEAGYPGAAPATIACYWEPRLMVGGIAWLAVGFLVYLIARPRAVAAFLAQAPDFIVLLPGQLRWLFGPVPTFVHVLAFCMMSASLVGQTRLRLLLCGAWATVEIGFEAAQHPAFRQWLSQCPAAMTSIGHMQGYLTAGTFDSSDILAGILGAACAALLLTPRKKGSQ